MKPFFVDFEQQWAAPETIEETAHRWVLKGAPVWEEHSKDISDKVKMVESYTLLEDLKLEGRNIQKGAWIAVFWIPDDDTWQKVQSGRFTGASVRGFSRARGGSPDISKVQKSEFGDKRLPPSFWEKVSKQGKHWIWTGAKNSKGYPAYIHKGNWMLAHRAAYEALVGAFPSGKTADHTCKTITCVNPACIEPVTNRENVRREYAK